MSTQDSQSLLSSQQQQISHQSIHFHKDQTTEDSLTQQQQNTEIESNHISGTKLNMIPERDVSTKTSIQHQDPAQTAENFNKDRIRAAINDFTETPIPIAKNKNSQATTRTKANINDQISTNGSDNSSPSIDTDDLFDNFDEYFRVRRQSEQSITSQIKAQQSAQPAPPLRRILIKAFNSEDRKLNAIRTSRTNERTESCKPIRSSNTIESQEAKSLRSYIDRHADYSDRAGYNYNNQPVMNTNGGNPSSFASNSNYGAIKFEHLNNNTHHGHNHYGNNYHHPQTNATSGSNGSHSQFYNHAQNHPRYYQQLAQQNYRNHDGNEQQYQRPSYLLKPEDQQDGNTFENNQQKKAEKPLPFIIKKRGSLANVHSNHHHEPIPSHQIGGRSETNNDTEHDAYQLTAFAQNLPHNRQRNKFVIVNSNRDESIKNPGSNTSTISYANNNNTNNGNETIAQQTLASQQQQQHQPQPPPTRHSERNQFNIKKLNIGPLKDITNNYEAQNQTSSNHPRDASIGHQAQGQNQHHAPPQAPSSNYYNALPDLDSVEGRRYSRHNHQVTQTNNTNVTENEDYSARPRHQSNAGHENVYAHNYINARRIARNEAMLSKIRDRSLQSRDHSANYGYAERDRSANMDHMRNTKNTSTNNVPTSYLNNNNTTVNYGNTSGNSNAVRIQSYISKNNKENSVANTSNNSILTGLVVNNVNSSNQKVERLPPKIRAVDEGNGAHIKISEMKKITNVLGGAGQKNYSKHLQHFNPYKGGLLGRPDGVLNGARSSSVPRKYQIV